MPTTTRPVVIEFTGDEVDALISLAVRHSDVVSAERRQSLIRKALVAVGKEHNRATERA